jgi:phage shock protein A
MARTAEEIRSESEWLAFRGAEAITAVIASYEHRLAGARRQVDIESETVAALQGQVRALQGQVFDLLKQM